MTLRFAKRALTTVALAALLAGLLGGCSARCVSCGTVAEETPLAVETWTLPLQVCLSEVPSPAPSESLCTPVVLNYK